MTTRTTPYLTDATIFESEEVQPGVILDFDEEGRVVGVEMLALSSRIEPEKLRVLEFETAQGRCLSCQGQLARRQPSR